MPRWAHLPLILKPDGNGKLSKRDGDRLGFPVFAMNWTDPATGETTKGFREMGFLPEAFLNMLAMLGWNDGSGKELFTLEELTEKFTLDRVHKGGAKFDFEKAKWFNHEWIRQLPVQAYQDQVLAYFRAEGINPLGSADGAGPAGPATALDPANELSEIAPAITGAAAIPVIDTSFVTPEEEKFQKILELVKDRCHLLTEFVQQAGFFFRAPDPAAIDLNPVRSKWNEAKQQFFVELIRQLQLMKIWEPEALHQDFNQMAAAAAIKPGDLLLPLRLMLVGGKFGPGVFDIAALLGPDETIRRIKTVLAVLQS
jgi:glutamyl-tRNA synthetase